MRPRPSDSGCEIAPALDRRFGRDGITLAVAGVVSHLFQTVWLSSLTAYVVWCVLLALVGWGLYLVTRGTRFVNKPGFLGTIGREYIASGMGNIFAALLFAALAAMQIFY
jgi:hypothetical protein